ncbi:MAG: hypothetical protein LBP80_00055 [Treponema sp.]|jgi:hypothetical protein|nr:hypothetical protein [Treponema sp.]
MLEILRRELIYFWYYFDIQARREINSGYKPPLAAIAEDINAYDVIFVGYPIWHGTTPPPVVSFLSEYDFAGKTVIPFCTSGSGSGDRSFRNVKSPCFARGNIAFQSGPPRCSGRLLAFGTDKDPAAQIGLFLTGFHEVVGVAALMHKAVIVNTVVEIVARDEAPLDSRARPYGDNGQLLNLYGRAGESDGLRPVERHRADDPLALCAGPGAGCGGQVSDLRRPPAE